MPAFESKDNHALPTRFGARRRVPVPHNKSRYRAERIKIKSRYLRDSGNPRRGFPTPKQSAGLFCLPSCAFAKEEISPCAQGDQRFYLWKPPPLKRRAKFYFRADSLQKNFLFRPTGNFLNHADSPCNCPQNPY